MPIFAELGHMVGKRFDRFVAEKSQEPDYIPSVKFKLGSIFVFDSHNSLVPDPYWIKILDGEHVQTNIPPALSTLNESDATSTKTAIKLTVCQAGPISTFVAEARENPKTSLEPIMWDEALQQGSVLLNDCNHQIIVQQVTIEKSKIEGEPATITHVEELLRAIVYPNDALAQVIITDRIFHPEDINGVPLASLTRHARMHFREKPEDACAGENTILFPPDLLPPDEVPWLRTPRESLPDVSLAYDRAQDRTILTVNLIPDPKVAPSGVVAVAEEPVDAKQQQRQPIIHELDEQNSCTVSIRPNYQYSLVEPTGRIVMSLAFDEEGNVKNISSTEKGAALPDGGKFRRIKYTYEGFIVPQSRLKESGRTTQDKLAPIQQEALREQQKDLEKKRQSLLEYLAHPIFINRSGQEIQRPQERLEEYSQSVVAIEREIKDIEDQLSGKKKKQKDQSAIAAMGAISAIQDKADAANKKSNDLHLLIEMLTQDLKDAYTDFLGITLTLPKSEKKSGGDPWLKKKEKQKAPKTKA